jgi:hypothetical protein
VSDRAPYSRVYWSVMEDAKFDGIREDVRHFGAWSLLLIVADMAWPAPAYVPQLIPRASLKALTEAGLVDPLSGGRFRIHGLDAERGRRRDAAQTGSKRPPNGTQTGSKRDPDGVLDEDETRRELDKLSRADARDEPHIEAWLMARHRPPTERQQAFLDRYLQVFDQTGPHRMAQVILEHPDDPIAFLKEDLDRHREERLAGLSAEPVSRPRPKPQREPWQELLREKLEADEAVLRERTRLPGDAA